jgi:2-polyprenyl-3-methyl-5-hydroxy-6-metoxy-1,4-benzoquinol methylase
MHANARVVLVAAALLVPLHVQAQSRRPARRGAPQATNQDYGEEYRARETRLSVRLVIEGLDLQPEQTVLDVGAGGAYLTFPIARALEGTGTVFATDVAPSAVDHIRSRAQQEGLTNVSAVLVSAGPQETFYREHTFDRVVLSHIIEYLENPEAFVRALRPSLRKGSGRLFIISPKPVPDLSSYQIRSPRAILSVLASGGASFPPFARLDPALQAFLLKWDPKTNVPPEEQQRLTAALERLLEDPRLYADLSSYAYQKTHDTAALFRKLHQRDVELAKWLVTRLDARGTFEKQWANLAEDERSSLMFLNRILLTATFRDGLVRIYNVGNRMLPFLEEPSLVARMKAAGYELVRAHGTLHSHYFLEFRRGD